MSLVAVSVALQSREQRKIEAIEKTFEKIEQRQKSGKRAASVTDVEPDSPDQVSLSIALLHLGIWGQIFETLLRTFSKDFPMSDYLGILKKFSYPNFRRLSFPFQRTLSFLIYLTSSTSQMHLYRPCDVIKTF